MLGALRQFALSKAQDVRDNYPLRVGVMWVVLALHGFILWGEGIAPHWFWGVVLLHTVIMPHVTFYFSSTRQHEAYNLTFDVTMYAIYIGAWGFNPFLAAVFLATSNLTLLSLGGWKPLLISIALEVIGALIGGAITGYYFRPQLEVTPMLIATGGFFTFMIGVGWLMHRINQRLHFTRRDLRERNNELAHINELAAAVNSQLNIDNIIARLLEALDHFYPLEAVYFLSYEKSKDKLVMAGIYGEAISYKERAAFEALEFDMVEDADSVFILGLKQRRVINVPHLHPDLVNNGAEIDKKLYYIKPSLSIIYFPVYIDGAAVGGLAFINHKYHCVLGKPDIKRISDYLVQVGTAIKNANLIRQQQQAKEEALLAQKKAEASEEAKSRFLANMSHEIRTPMTAILGYSEALQEHDISVAERLEFVDIIMRSGKHLLSMINNILDISKIEASKVHIEKISIDVVHMMDDIESYVRLKAHEKGLSYSLTVNYPVPSRITNDPTRLKQVLLNLCNNALKFTDKGSIDIELSWPKENLLNFAVRDTGIGMSSDECETIFDAFAQADTSTTRLYGGTGLGLTISKSLAMLMGGNLTVASKKGEGSCFTLAVDIGERPSSLIESPDAWQQLKKVRQDKRVERKIPELSGRVLVAEDNPVNQQIIRRLLEQTGLDVDLVDNGEKALTKAKNGLYDIVFLDMQMPVMGGQEAAVKLREAGFKVPLVAFTANVMTHQVHSYFESGFVDVIEKPINRDKLYRLLTQLMAVSASKLHTLLVVDDDEVNTMILARQIKKYRAGLNVLTASNGEEALLAASSADIDLIFMDMEMPVMGGLEATKALREQGFNYPIYMVTGNIDQEHKQLCMAAGATGHVPKPIDKERVNKILSLY